MVNTNDISSVDRILRQTITHTDLSAWEIEHFGCVTRLVPGLAGLAI